jgi:probable rRNA maturation factor
VSASLVVDIQRASESAGLPTDGELAAWARAGFQGEEEAEVTVRLVDEAESAEFNGRYRGKDRPTNVLSFPFEAPPDIPLNLLGDLVICAGVVATEANAQQKSISAHWAHMVIHGMLHLQGYDHVNLEDAVIMEGLETRLLSALGFPAPYPDEETETHS